MKQVTSITVDELSEMAENMYGDIVKAVVDTEKGLLVVDAEMHVDEEQYLLAHGSLQSNLWGINFHPAEYGTEQFVKFDSMINIRPSQNNRSRGVTDEAIRRKIMEVVDKRVSK